MTFKVTDNQCDTGVNVLHFHLMQVLDLPILGGWKAELIMVVAIYWDCLHVHNLSIVMSFRTSPKLFTDTPCIEKPKCYLSAAYFHSSSQCSDIMTKLKKKKMPKWQFLPLLLFFFLALLSQLPAFFILPLLTSSYVVFTLHVFVSWQWEAVQCNWDHPVCEEEGRVGIALDRGPERFLCRAPCGVCCGRRNLFLRVVCCHLLAEETWSDAWTDLQQWAYQPWWGLYYSCYNSVY